MAGLTFFNSKECEWADMSVLFGGAPLMKVREVRYKSSKEKQHLHGAGDKPISIQGGNRMYEGQIKVLKGALDDMQAAAIAAGGVDVLDISFDVVVTYRAKAGRPLQTDTLVGVQIKEFEKGWEQGSKYMEITLPIIFLDVL